MTRAGTVNALSRPIVDPDPEWRESAACSGLDTELWFDGDTATGKALCAACPVRALCLAWAMANRQEYGVWGGVDERARNALRQSSRPACGNGHPLTPTTTLPSGKCRRCDDASRENRQIEAGVVLSSCRCGRRIAPRKGFVPYHVDRMTGERCPGTGERAEVKA